MTSMIESVRRAERVLEHKAFILKHFADNATKLTRTKLMRSIKGRLTRDKSMNHNGRRECFKYARELADEMAI